MSSNQKKKRSRVYVCHTIYHAYIASLKELKLRADSSKEYCSDTLPDLVLSTMSNDFGSFPDRAQKSGLWNEVHMFNEKEDIYFPDVCAYHTDRGNIVSNMIARIKYTKLLGKKQQDFVPVDFSEYLDVYVFCDSDPIGYYLNYKKIPYHAVEDGLDTVFYCDDALYSNLGHLKLKIWMAEHGLIHIPDGYAKYCIDMEVNNSKILDTPCKKYKEVPRRPLYERLTPEDKDLLVHMFVENVDELSVKLTETDGEGCEKKPIVLILTDPLCDLVTRRKIFEDIIEEYGFIDGEKAKILIKPHPRDVLNYESLFPDEIVLPGKFPMEMMNFIPGVLFDRVVTVFTVPDAIDFAKEKVFLGADFMDKYEDPAIHRQNEAVKANS